MKIFQENYRPLVRILDERNKQPFDLAKKIPYTNPIIYKFIGVYACGKRRINGI